MSRPPRTSLSRRQALKLAALGAGAALLPLGARRAYAQDAGAADRKLLFVVTATGGASITDSFLPITESEAGNIRAFPTSVVRTSGNSTLRTVGVLQNSIEGAIGLGNGFPMVTLLDKHGADVAVLTHEGTSVNHLVAAKRSLNGAGAFRGRTILECAAMRHGDGCPLPNVNMASGGYAEHGDDPTVPDSARGEPVVDAKLFAFSTDGARGVRGAPPRAAIERARYVREQIEKAGGFRQTFGRADVLRRYLEQRDANARMLEDGDLITKLMMLSSAPGGAALSDWDLETSPSGDAIVGKFPQLATDPLDAQGALAFLLARYGISCAVCLGPNSSPVFESADNMLQPPIAFDWSHNDHVGAQNSMWSRTLKTVDGLIDLLKATDYMDDPSLGKMWDRSVVYIATEFGREKSGNGTAHDLNNGSVVISPMIRGNRVYGGVDANTGRTFGCDPVTGAPTPGAVLAERDLFSALAHTLDIDFDGRVDWPALVRS